MIAQQDNRPAPPPQDELLSKREVAAILKISQRTIDRLRHAGKIPQPIMVGRLPRWRRSDFDAWSAQSSN